MQLYVFEKFSKREKQTKINVALFLLETTSKVPFTTRGGAKLEFQKKKHHCEDEAGDNSVSDLSNTIDEEKEAQAPTDLVHALKHCILQRIGLSASALLHNYPPINSP